MAGRLATLFACGDVMPGRGIDQILPHPGDPELQEDYASDASAYVRLAVRAKRADPAAGLLLALGRCPAGGRGGCTGRPDHQPGNKRHPQRGLRPRQGRALPDEPGKPAVRRRDPARRLRPGQQSRAGLRRARAAGDPRCAGRGGPCGGRSRTRRRRSRAARRHPAAGRGRILVFCCGTASSGIPPQWAATITMPGVNLLPGLSSAAADALIIRALAARQHGDLVVVSIHWGSNWGYGVHGDQVRFAHQLIDGGIDLIHGHSRVPSRCTVASSSSTAAATASTTTKASPATRSTEATCGYCTSRR